MCCFYRISKMRQNRCVHFNVGNMVVFRTIKYSKSVTSTLKLVIFMYDHGWQ